MANAQYVTLIENNPALVDLLKYKLSISNKLLAKGLITKEVAEYSILTSGELDWKKASRLISCVTDRVRHDDTGQLFFTFLDVLSEEPFFTEIVKKIRVCHEVKMLKKDFLSMQEQLQSEIETNSEVSPEMLVGSLILLPESIRWQYQTFVSRNLRTLNRVEAIRALFCHLKPHFTFLDYQVLEYLINQFGKAKLKVDMSIYSRKVRVFMQRTTIQQLIDSEWSGQHDIPSHFAKLEVSMLIRDIEHYSLLQLDNLKQKLCMHLPVRRTYYRTAITKCCLNLVEVTRQNAHTLVYWVLPSILCSDLPSDSVIRLNGLSDNDKDNGGRGYEDDRDDDQGGACGLSRKRGNKVTNKDVTKRPKQDCNGKRVKKLYYEVLLKMAVLFGDTFLPIRKEKKLYNNIYHLQQRKPMARSIQIQYC